MLLKILQNDNCDPVINFPEAPPIQLLQETKKWLRQKIW